MVYVTQSAGRIMRCLAEICLKRGWANVAERALTLCKEVNHRMWSSQTPLRQFKGVPNDVLARLEKKDLAWERYYDLSSQELGELIRMPKYGKSLHKLVHQFPRLELGAHVQPLTRSTLRVDLTLAPDFAWDDKVHGAVEPFWILVEDADGEVLLHHQFWLLRRAVVAGGEEASLSFTLPIGEPLPPMYFVRAVSDRWLGCEAVLPISFRHLILPEKFPPPTELLDLQPLPVTALRNAAFEALYSSPKGEGARPINTFNAIQTQAFNALYHTDENVLLAAPTGSGKTVAAEFAILRALAKAQEGKGTARVVYVAPLDAIVSERAADWGAKFGPGGLGLSVEVLTGEGAPDLKRLERGQLVLSSAANWDMISRRWKQRKNVQNVALFIVDELHLIGGAPGPKLEIACSRMRYLSAQRASDGAPPVRIVGLSHSLANARDVGEWLGAGPHGLFNFSPGAMTRPSYSAIPRHAAGGQPAL
ncbi:U5 small nuclear ribonucleoprotein 200 kDa helicase-like, partial [Raphidocelis subcapitata]